MVSRHSEGVIYVPVSSNLLSLYHQGGAEKSCDTPASQSAQPFSNIPADQSAQQPFSRLRESLTDQSDDAESVTSESEDTADTQQVC